MRLIPFALLVVMMFAAVTAAAPALAAGERPAAPDRASMRQSTPGTVDDNDDSRVGVQLVVAGIAAGVVVGVGTGAYLLRRKLGLTAYSPDQAAGGDHH